LWTIVTVETVPLNLRVEGRTAARAAYEGYFTAFPDLLPLEAARTIEGVLCSVTSEIFTP
jgi:hypothetical protein